MKLLHFIIFFLLTACKDQIHISNIEQREHGLNYIKGTDKLVNGQVVGKFDNGKIAERHTYKQGKPIGNWYAYGFDGEIVSHGFGIDAKKYEPQLKNVDLKNSVLSINIEGSYSYATLYLDNPLFFDNHNDILDLSRLIFKDYATYNIEDLLLFDDQHEYTISKIATLNNNYNIDTVQGKGKRTIFIK